MLRLWFIAIVSLPSILAFTFKAWFIRIFRNICTEKFCYKVARKTLLKVMHRGFITTEIIGRENLPAEGGYVMFSNHQGKYDAVGIMYGHESPCTIMMDKKRSKLPVMNDFLSIIKGTRLDTSSIKRQIASINRVVTEVKAGRRYIIFPEGGYNHNRNNVEEFKPGAFKVAVKSKCPIVPVVVIDSWKPFEINSLRPVNTKVMFLKPIYYEEYKDWSSVQIAENVRNLIISAMDEKLAESEK